MSKFRKHEYRKKSNSDDFKKIKDPGGKRRDRKKMRDYEIDYNQTQ
jgi:hypothetical protein